MEDTELDLDMDVDVGEIDWMTLADPYILQFLDLCADWHQQPAKQTPKTIGLNTPIDRKQAGARCRVLEEKGLVERTERGVYRLTDLGVRFVDGQLTTEDLQELNGQDE